MTNGLAGRVALVTGASRGIGFAIVRALQGEGVKVVGLARDEAALKAAADGLAEKGESELLMLSADVTDNASVKQALERAYSWTGRLDIVVNCAGPQLTPSPLTQTPDSVLADYLNVKLLGFHRVASAALPLLSSSGTGRIINVAGQTARTLVPNAGVTGIANAAVIALTSYLASEAAARNILVNAISPGMTLTEGWRGKFEAMATQQGKSAEQLRDAMSAGAGIRLGRFAEPDEIAKCVVFLASDLASYMTGRVLEVDGGISKAVS